MTRPSRPCAAAAVAEGGLALLRVDIVGRTGNMDQALTAERGEMVDDRAHAGGIVEMDRGMLARCRRAY